VAVVLFAAGDADGRLPLVGPSSAHHVAANADGNGTYAALGQRSLFTGLLLHKESRQQIYNAELLTFKAQERFTFIGRACRIMRFFS